MHAQTCTHAHTQSKACRCCWTVYPDKLGMSVHQAGTVSQQACHARMCAHTHTMQSLLLSLDGHAYVGFFTINQGNALNYDYKSTIN